MASLTEVYQGGGGPGLRRLYAGVALFGVGAVLVTTGLVVVSTGLGSSLGLGQYRAREFAGVLGGLGFPAVLLGTMVALPSASRWLRTVAAAGTLACLAGVAMFAHWYPIDWVGGSGNTSMTLVVSATYLAGAIVTSWCLFTAVAGFKARNDPGGTVSLEITKEGETRVVEVSNDELRSQLGGIGMLGGTPDGEAETQTNRPDPESRSSSDAGSRSSSQGGSRNPSSPPRNDGATPNPTDGGVDGGSIHDVGVSDDAELLEDGRTTPIDDRYCGNCGYFRYVRTEDGLVPYCGLDSRAMENMDACDEWSSNTGS